MARSQKSQSEAQKEAQMRTSNKALWFAIQSAQKRGLLDATCSYQVARQISMASSKYYLAFTGQMTQEELKTAIETVFNYEDEQKFQVC